MLQRLIVGKDWREKYVKDRLLSRHHHNSVIFTTVKDMNDGKRKRTLRVGMKGKVVLHCRQTKNVSDHSSSSTSLL